MPMLHCSQCGIEHFVQQENFSQGKGYLCTRCKNAKKKSIKSQPKGRKKSRKKTSSYKICLICGKEFYVRPSMLKAGKGKYCSRECASKAQKLKDTVPCPWCGKLFVKRAGQIYCSRSCSAYANHALHGRQPDHTQRCIVCGKKFKHGVTKQICSTACLTRHRKGSIRRGYALFEAPWATGEIPPDKLGHNLYRQPDPVLGF